MKHDSYQNLTSTIAWNGERSEKIDILRGSKQGGIASTNDYIEITGDGLDLLETCDIGVSIGAHFLGNPTVADDTMCLSFHPGELQTQLDTLTFFANKEHYDIHPGKSSITVFNKSTKIH